MDPYERSPRYLKFLLKTIASKQMSEFFKAYRKIKMSNYGSPLTVSYSDCNINAEYLASVEEWSFLKSYGRFK